MLVRRIHDRHSDRPALLCRCERLKGRVQVRHCEKHAAQGLDIEFESMDDAILNESTDRMCIALERRKRSRTHPYVDLLVQRDPSIDIKQLGCSIRHRALFCGNVLRSSTFVTRN